MVQYHTAITVALVGGVALISLALTVLAFRARARTGSSRLMYVALAFLLFCIKSSVTAVALLWTADGTSPSPEPFPLGHGHLEFIGSAFDVAIVALLAAPFVRRRAAA